MSGHDDISEQRLIKDYQSTGDQKKLGKLFTPYMELTYGVCLKYLKDKSAAQDAVMDIYEKISKKLKAHEIEAFRPWLYVVAKNHCFEKLRKQSRSMEKEMSAHDMYSTTVFHPDSIDKEAKLTQIEICMEKLNAEQKTCVEAFYYKSMSYEQIAETYKLKWNTVRSSIQNGRRNLKKCIDKL